MALTPLLFPKMIAAIDTAIAANAEEVTALDQAIGDGDHVTNLQRGIQALSAQTEEIAALEDWVAAWQKIGMSVMSSVGGASGSLYATLFIAMSKAGKDRAVNLKNFAEVFAQAVDAVKKRGKADVGEKTMLDVLSPVAGALQKAAAEDAVLAQVLESIKQSAVAGMESTRDMLATKGRASFLGERTRGHIDAGARTAQLMICVLADVLTESLNAPTQ